MLRYEQAMILGEDSKSRMLGFDSLSKELSQLLSNPASISDSLEFLRSLSVLYVDDTTRVLSLQCEKTPDQYVHLGFIQTRDSTYQLDDASDQLANPISEQVGPDRWYGALYFHIQPFVRDGKPHYLLFGFDGHSQSSRRKLIEVLTFTPDGYPIFGLEVFDHPFQHDVSRFLLQYSAEVSVRLNYDSDLEMIIYDHLIPMKSIYRNESVVMVSDGSYEGFKLTDGTWRHVDKVFHQVNDGTPGEGLPEDRKKLFQKN